MIGAVAVIGGLYILLWGKARDINTQSKPDIKDDSSNITTATDTQYNNHAIDITEPLIVGISDDLETQTEK